MIVLDTNIVSELQNVRPSSNVLRWMLTVDVADTFICGPVLMEQAYGAERLFLKTTSTRYRETLALMREEYAARTLPITGGAFELAGRLRAQRERRGRPLSISDSMIAAICLAHGATLATRNVRDFDGLDLKLVNPFEAAA